MQKRHIALAGCGALMFGVFAPVMQVPFAGDMTYLEFGSSGRIPAGWITLGIAATALLATFARRYSLLWAAGIASLGLEAWALGRAQEIIGAVRATAGAEDSIRGTLAGAIQLQWGWPVLAVGGIALLIAAGMQLKDDRSRNAAA